jgi:hypothetical protein
LKLFSVFLGISIVTEILAAVAVPFFHFKSNYPVYGAFMLVEYSLYALFFKFVIQHHRIRQIINAFLLSFPVVWATTTFFVFGPRHWNSYVILFGDAITIGMCVAYFYEVFVSEDLLDFRTSPEFWIVAATLIYSCCELPITGMLNYLAANYETQALWLENALQILNILMYLMILYAYLCRRLINTTKYS